jgi:plasmid stabilization system protein ParE
MAHGSVMARRQVLTSVGGYRSTFRHAEDYEIWLRITERYRIANLSERLMCYRRHSHSVSRAHHYEQRLATHVALLCARERRSGRPDPMTGFKHISLADVLRLEVEENQRAMIVRSMLEDCRRQSAIARKPLPARVRAAMQNIARWL